MAKKKAVTKKKAHRHPAYDPTIEAGTVTLTREQAEAAVLAISDGICSLPPMLQQRALVAVDAMDIVFGLGIRSKKRKAKK